MNVFDFVKAVNEKQEVEWNDITEKEYSPWIVNRAFSFMSDTLLHANLMNQNAFLPKKMQFDFFYYGIPKGRRFGKWQKKDKPEADVELLKKYYCINNLRAEEALAILTDEQLTIIRNFEGGKQ